jgi:hypothetical protein
MIHTFTAVEPKKPWRNYYQSNGSNIQWINELAITDQRTIFNHMDEYFKNNLEFLVEPKTNYYFDRNIVLIQEYFTPTETILYVQTRYKIPLLLSFSEGFTTKNIVDIIQWYKQIQFLEKPWDPPNFVEKFTLSDWLNDMPEFNVAVEKATIANKPNKVTHFVFKGYNIFIESKLLMILYVKRLHGTPFLWQTFPKSCETKSDNAPKVMNKITQCKQKDGTVEYEGILPDGQTVTCTKEGNIISYLPPPVSPKKSETKETE